MPMVSDTVTNEVKPTVLAYAQTRDRVPLWVARLAKASMIVGTLWSIGNALRVRDAWQYVFDPTFHWAYPPPEWIPPMYLVSVIASVVVSAYLVFVGIRSLYAPHTARRLYQLFILFQIPLAVVVGFLRAGLMWNHPDVPGGMMAGEFTFLVMFDSIYPIIVAMTLWRLRDERKLDELQSASN